MKKAAFVLLVLGAVTGGFYFYRVRTAAPEPVVTTQPFSRGDIVDAVSATGTLEAVETVEVGTQVSGVVRELNADFNSIVRKGQVIARLDPQLIQTQIEQQSANVLRAEADLDRLKVSLADAEQKLERAQQLNARNLIPRTELDTAAVDVNSAKAQVKASEASVTQARAQLRNQRVNLAYTTITAPIDGIVISRNVDAGQTVAASMNAPTLFVLAADLTRMQVRGQHRRIRRRTHPARAVRHLPGRRLPDRPVHRHRVAGASAADGGAERGDLLDGHHRAQPRVEAQAGDDGQRHHRDRAPEQRAAGRQCGDAVPADRRDVLGAEPARSAGVAADRRRGTRRTCAQRRRQPVIAPAAAQRAGGSACPGSSDAGGTDRGVEGDDDRRACSRR